MINGVQREKAQAKILEQEGVDPARHRAMLNHIKAVYYCHLFKLPYRVCLDYIKRPRKQGEVELNDCYPLPGYPKDKVLSVHYPSDFIKAEDNIYSVNGIYNLDNLTDKAREQIEKHNEQFRTGCIFFDTERADFARLLEGYDLKTFSVFDWFGSRAEELSTPDDKMDKDSLGCMANVYKVLLDSYLEDKAEHPSKYRRHKYTDNELDRYQAEPFNIIWDTEREENEQYEYSNNN